MNEKVTWSKRKEHYIYSMLKLKGELYYKRYKVGVKGNAFRRIKGDI